MYDSFIDQLSGLDLSGLSIRPAPFNQTDFPCEDAIEQTLGAVWSDLFAMFSDTALEADAEDIAWGVVNLFHRAASRKSAQLDRAGDEIRACRPCRPPVVTGSADQMTAVTTEVTIGTPVPTPMPTPTGTATWPSEKRPEARPIRPPARLSTVMILPPEPSRKSVNFVRAGVKVVSAPA